MQQRPRPPIRKPTVRTHQIVLKPFTEQEIIARNYATFCLKLAHLYADAGDAKSLAYCCRTGLRATQGISLAARRPGPTARPIELARSRQVPQRNSVQPFNRWTRVAVKTALPRSHLAATDLHLRICTEAPWKRSKQQCTVNFFDRWVLVCPAIKHSAEHHNTRSQLKKEKGVFQRWITYWTPPAIAMQVTRGRLHFHPLFNLASLGLKDSGIHVDRIIREFLKIGEAIAARWIQMPRGILLLQMVPGRPDTGAIYLYDRHHQMFYMLGFDAAEDNLTVEEFDDLSAEYQLLKYIEEPGLVRAVSEQKALPLSPAKPLKNALSLTLADIGRLITGHGLFRTGTRLAQFNLHCSGSA